MQNSGCNEGPVCQTLCPPGPKCVSHSSQSYGGALVSVDKKIAHSHGPLSETVLISLFSGPSEHERNENGAVVVMPVRVLITEGDHAATEPSRISDIMVSPGDHARQP
jgi:hypothetical protein